LTDFHFHFFSRQLYLVIMKVSLSPRAYSKVLLHACKYPHKAVNGVLLAEECKHTSDLLRIVDTIPLFHQCLGLAPMLEIALNQIDSYCRSNQLVIAGYYQGNENYNDNDPDFIAYKIGEKLVENSQNSILMMIDNQKMDVDCKETALKLYQMQDNKWKENSTWHLVGGETALACSSDLMRSKTYQSLVDFDNHLDDITSDWLNPHLNKVIELTSTGE